MKGYNGNFNTGQDDEQQPTTADFMKAARDSGSAPKPNIDQIQMPGRVENQLERAKQLLSQAVGDSRHSSGCALGAFQYHVRGYPTNHPIHLSAPACNCWYGAARVFLNSD